MLDINDLGGISEPATALINRCANGLGALFQPTHIKRLAQAEAEANIIRVKSEIESDKLKARAEIEVADLKSRAIDRLIHVEAKNQKNIEDVIQQALPLLNDDAQPDKIEEDWLNNFFDRVKLVSHDEMQTLWSRILAGEANHQGSYSLRTLNLLQSMSIYEATLFHRVCQFTIEGLQTIPGVNRKPFIWDLNDEIYKQGGLGIYDILNLQSVGLVIFSHEQIHTVNIQRIPDTVRIAYANAEIIFEVNDHKNTRVRMGQITFTQIGNELSRLCDIEPIEGFPQYIADRLTANGFNPQIRIK